METVIKSLPSENSPGPEGVGAEFCRIFKEESLTVFHKLEREGTLPNSLYVTSITPIPDSECACSSAF